MMRDRFPRFYLNFKGRVAIFSIVIVVPPGPAIKTGSREAVVSCMTDNTTAEYEETGRQSALHADIFGEDDSDDDDVTSAPTHHTADERVQRIAANRDGAGSDGITKKKRKRAIRKSTAPWSDARCLQKRQTLVDDAVSAEGMADSFAGGDSGNNCNEADGECDEEEREEQFDSELEAVEAGGKGDFEHIISGLKGRRGGIQRSHDALIAEVQNLQARMDLAADHDEEASKEDQPTPAVHKLAMLREVTELMQKRHAHEALVDVGMLSTLSRWLKPLHDGSLVTLQVRTALLRSLSLLDVDETMLGALHSSGIGKYIKLLSLHSKELPHNRRQAGALIEKWSRPIFGSSAQFVAADMPSAQPRHSPGSLHIALPRLSALEEAGGPPSGMTNRGTRIPRRLGMDFSVQPTSIATALPSSKLGKETVKGRLQERMVGAGRKSSGGSQAFSLSIEGRTLDRL